MNSGEPNFPVQPTADQQAWMQLKFGLFLHFGINTFYDLEWSDGTLDPIRYAPSELDTDQWCAAASAAGMKFVVLVTKHCDGFCNWPTRFTNYSVKKSSYRGDLVAAVARSAEKFGLKLGLYYSLWDCHEKSHDTDDRVYAEFMKNQLTELLTGYGSVVELWFDGMWKKQKTGWDGDETGFVNAWRSQGAPRWHWDEIYRHVKTLQPGCVVLNNSTTKFPGVPLWPVDARPGERATDQKAATGALDKKIWQWNGNQHYLPLQIETTLSKKGPPGQFENGSWFWHEWDNSVAEREEILSWLQSAEQEDAVLLLNAGPMASGKLRPVDWKTLTALRK
jgi:alpha-L-fucosidase